MEYGLNFPASQPFPEPASILPLSCSASQALFLHQSPNLPCSRSFSHLTTASSVSCMLLSKACHGRSVLPEKTFLRTAVPCIAFLPSKTCFLTHLPALISPCFSRGHPGSLSLAKFYVFPPAECGKVTYCPVIFPLCVVPGLDPPQGLSV